MPLHSLQRRYNYFKKVLSLMHDLVETPRGGPYWGYCFHERPTASNGTIRLKSGRGKGVRKLFLDQMPWLQEKLRGLTIEQSLNGWSVSSFDHPQLLVTGGWPSNHSLSSQFWLHENSFPFLSDIFEHYWSSWYAKAALNGVSSLDIGRRCGSEAHLNDSLSTHVDTQFNLTI